MYEYYTKKELQDIGFSKVGNNVKISKKCSLFSISGSIGDETRIDDFVILKGEFILGNKVHICSHSSLSAVGGTIKIEDLCGIGVGNIFYTASDDMLSSGLCGPLVEKKFTKIKTGQIHLKKGVALGGRVTVMPNCVVGKFTAVGISGIVLNDLDHYSVYMQINGRLKKVAKRNENLLEQYAKESLI